MCIVSIIQSTNKGTLASYFLIRISFSCLIASVKPSSTIFSAGIQWTFLSCPSLKILLVSSSEHDAGCGFVVHWVYYVDICSL